MPTVVLPTRRHLLLVTALACALGLSGAIAHSAEREHYSFRVLLDEKPIGEHSFSVRRTAGRETVDIKADFDVTFLAIPVYTYDHVNREVWNGGCLDEISSRTDDNGATFVVGGETRGATFSVSTGDGTRTLDASCVMTFAYWNPAFLTQQRLLNAQTGEYLPVATRFEGRERLTLGGERYTALRYRLRNDVEEIDLTVWYEQASGRWLSLESRVAGGKVIRYLPTASAGIEAGAVAASLGRANDGVRPLRRRADDSRASR